MRAETRWTLAAFGVATAVAVTDALLGARLVLIGLLIAGPMLAAIRLDGLRTGLVAGYALALAVALGPVDGIWGTADHLVRCSVVAVGGGFATAIAFSRSGRARRMAQITRGGPGSANRLSKSAAVYPWMVDLGHEQPER